MILPRLAIAAAAVMAAVATPAAAAPAARSAEAADTAGLVTEEVRVEVDTAAIASTFDPRFASVTYDIQNFLGFKIYPWAYDWASAELKQMVAALSPMTVRCGGTWEDGTFWEAGPQTGHRPDPKGHMLPQNLTASEWTPFVEFMNSIPGVDLVVGLNGLLRDWGGCSGAQANETCPGDLPWDPRNAASFIRRNHKAGHQLWGYELGNEPGVWNWTWRTPIVTPRQHAADYAALRELLSNEFGDEQEDGSVPPPVPPSPPACHAAGLQYI